MDLLEKAIKDQFKAFGMPRGDSEPNAARAQGLELLSQRRASGAGVARLKDDSGKDWGYAAVLIPPLDYAVLLKGNPELNSRDRETRNRAWKRLFKEFGHVYGVDSGIGRTKRNTGIIVK